MSMLASCACDLFGVTGLDEPLILPPEIDSASAPEKLAFIMKMSRMLVEQCSLLKGFLTNETVVDGVYSYARILRH